MSCETKQGAFLEVLPADEYVSNKRLSYVDAYVASVQPTECGSLLKKFGSKVPPSASLSSRPSSILVEATVDLGHLRRVRRRKVVPVKNDTDPLSDDSFGTLTKPPKAEIELHVVLGAVSDVDKLCRRRQTSAAEYFCQEYGATKVIVEAVPARMAESEEELQEFNKVWPTVFYPNKTREHRRRERLLKEDELEQMEMGMQAALKDALGAVMLDTKAGTVVSRAEEESRKQNAGYGDGGGGGVAPKNPLSTPILLAIQGVSRREREAACRVGMDDPAFHKGQYLCTGFDCYTAQEPSVFEAMSLVHSRIRRVVFGAALPDKKGGLLEYKVHCLPNTNHNFRAFVCQSESELGKYSMERINEK